VHDMVEQTDVWSAESILTNGAPADPDHCVLMFALQVCAYDRLEGSKVRIALQHSAESLPVCCQWLREGNKADRTG